MKGWVPALALTVAASGCATSSRREAANPAPVAVGTSPADSTWLSHPDAVYAAAVVLATPGAPSWDPERARDLLLHLVKDFPRSRHAADAAVRLPLLDEIVSLRAALRQLREIDLAPGRTPPRPR